MLESLAGKVIVLTGATGGFGQSMTETFVKAGSKIMAVDINAAAGAALEAKYSGSVAYIDADITLAASWEAILKECIARFGPPDVLINNAGFLPKRMETHLTPIEVYDKVYNINVRSMFLSVQTFVTFWLAQPKRKSPPSVINLTSSTALKPGPMVAYYSSSKSAVIGATKSLAFEYAPQIRFNCIAPALAQTGMYQAALGPMKDTPESQALFVSGIPMGRLAVPSDIANMAAYLASDEASFITGTVMAVDGGNTM